MRIPRPIYFLYAVGLSLGLLAGLNYSVTSWMGMERFDFLRLGVESNLPSWFSTVQLFLVALVFSLIGWRDATWRSVRTWPAALPGLFFFLLSLDEGAQVHERLGWIVEAKTGLGANLMTGAWLFVVVPIYALLALAAARALWPYFRGRTQVLTLGVVGCVMFVVGAAGFEALGNFTDPTNEGLRRILGVFEEVGEMVAATTLLWAGISLSRAEGFRLVSGKALPEAHETFGDGFAVEANLQPVVSNGLDLGRPEGFRFVAENAMPEAPAASGDGLAAETVLRPAGVEGDRQRLPFHRAEREA